VVQVGRRPLEVGSVLLPFWIQFLKGVAENFCLVFSESICFFYMLLAQVSWDGLSSGKVLLASCSFFYLSQETLNSVGIKPGRNVWMH
jgi:hypothetical protein